MAIDNNKDKSFDLKSALHVDVARPGADDRVEIKVLPNTVVSFDFPLSDARAEVDGVNLILNFDNGGAIVLLNFFPSSGDTVFTAIETADNQIIPADVFLSSLLKLGGVAPAEGVSGNENPGPENTGAGFGGGAGFGAFNQNFDLPDIRGIGSQSGLSGGNTIDGFSIFSPSFLNSIFGIGSFSPTSPSGGNNSNAANNLSDLSGNGTGGGTGGGNSGGGNNGGGNNGGGNNNGGGVNPPPPPPPPPLSPLFSGNDDTVNFNTLLKNTYVDGTQYNGLAGNDSVILPNDSVAAALAGFSGTTFNAGDGNDIVIGGIQDDVIFGDAGDDILAGNNGNDALDGGLGNDQIFGGDGADAISGGDGNDLLFGDAGNDIINGGDGNDVINGGAGFSDQLSGGSGNDIITDNDGVASALGGDGDDRITINFDALNSNNSLYQIQGGSGNDVIDITMNRSDFVLGLYADALVPSANDGNDIVTLHGTYATSKTLLGGGNDVFTGGDGDDIVYGGDGNDTITGGKGLDILYGGNGNDSFAFTNDRTGLFTEAMTKFAFNDAVNRDDGGRIYNFEFRPLLDGEDTTDATAYQTSHDKFFGDAGVDTLNGTSFNDMILFDSSFTPLSYSSHAPVKPIQMIDSIEIVNAGDGDDFVSFSSVNFSYSTPLTINGGNGNDTLIGGNGKDVINGDAGNDNISGGAGDDVLSGGDGSDSLYGGSGDDTLSGGDGNDYLIGGSGDDQLIGGKGSDVLQLSGGDTVFWNAGDTDAGEKDSVYGFQTGVQKLDISALLSDFNGDITRYVRFVDDAFNSSTQLQIDSDGGRNGQVWQTIATVYGASFSTSTIKYSDLIATV